MNYLLIIVFNYNCVLNTTCSKMITLQDKINNAITSFVIAFGLMSQYSEQEDQEDQNIDTDDGFFEENSDFEEEPEPDDDFYEIFEPVFKYMSDNNLYLSFTRYISDRNIVKQILAENPALLEKIIIFPNIVNNCIDKLERFY